MKLANDDFDIDAKVVFIAENLDHAPARIAGRRRPLGDLYFDDHAFQIAPLVLSRLGAQHAIAIGMLLARRFRFTCLPLIRN